MEEGTIVKVDQHPHIYLVVNGAARHIPNPQTYSNLFGDWPGWPYYYEISQEEFNELEVGLPFSDGAALVKSCESPDIYLIDQGTRRRITCSEVMDTYHFSWNKVTVLPRNQIDFMTPGDDFTLPQGIELAQK